MARVPASTAGDESVTQPRYTARWASQSLRIASRLDQPTVLRLFRLGSRIASYDHGLPTMSGTKPSDSIGRPSDRRKLIAVIYADMVGYSRLIGLDDIGTLERLRHQCWSVLRRIEIRFPEEGSPEPEDRRRLWRRQQPAHSVQCLGSGSV